MTYLYPLLVFVHLLGAVGLFAAIAVEALLLRRLRAAETAADARASLGLLASTFRGGPAAMAAVLVSGAAMMAMAWGREAWLVAAFVGLVAMGALGGAVSLRRVRRLRAALASEGDPRLSEAFRSELAAGALTASLRLRLAIGVGILALMTFKPGAAGSTLVLAAAAVLGIAAGLPLASPRALPAETSQP